MSAMNRRELLAVLLAGVAQAAGAVVLAKAEPPSPAEPAAATPRPPERRADELADALPDGQEFVSFLNTTFRNGHGFRNGGFGNGGGFRNNSFRNGGFGNGGSFRNNSFRNY